MVTKEESHIAAVESEKNDDYTNDDLYNITSWGADLSFRELITMYQEDELLKPEIQRHYVWDKPEASRFIDSLLMGLPVPSIFLAKAANEKKLIVDGYQRVMTVNDYVRGIFSKDGKTFKLSNTEKIHQKWRGKAFSELDPELQRKIRSTTIHAIIFDQKHPAEDDTSLFQVFERINTSGRSLTPQEIRNCIYQGKFSSLLIDLNRQEIWRDLFGLKEIDSRMRDIEFILRFFGLRVGEIRNQEKGQISLKKHLNEVMKADKSNSDDILSERRHAFLNTMSFLYEHIGTDVFHNISEREKKMVPKFHPTVFDSISIATDIALSSKQDIDIDNLKNKRMDLLNDEEFKDSTRVETMRIEKINKRINLAMKYLYDIDI